ncbi:MAG: hypothetical protein ABL894_08570 [Hyphomicrobium sp.]
MKFAIIAVVIAAAALGGCRREMPYNEPMKLGGQAELGSQK